MVLWVWVVIALAVVQMALIPYSVDATYLHISSILILFSALGILYRIYRKQRDGRIESLENRVSELERKIAELGG